MKLFITLILNSIFLFRNSHANEATFFLSYMNGSEFIVESSTAQLNTVNLKWMANAFYNNSANSTGWDLLEIVTNPELMDADQAYSAGWLEGYLTQKHIYYHWYNTQKDSCSKIPETCKNIKEYINKNMEWIKKKVKTNVNDPYWHQVMLYYKQLDGLYDGYRKAVKTKTENITSEDLLLLNYVTDIMTLTESLANKTETKHIKKSGHCSVLIKLIPGFSDVFFAHNSWITYNFMNRIIKRYKFAYHWTQNSIKLIPGHSQAFSSYAGVITSIDDFYIINSGLFVTETTNNVYNMEIYENNKPIGQVLETVRSTVANRLAHDSSSWSHYFSMMNSGTYNNQWMIVDLNKFRKGFEPQPGFLRVLEQMPGLIESQDQTQHILAYSYWASYNIPFYSKIYNYSGYNTKFEEHGSYYSYKECSRAKIFEREQKKVVDLNSMIKTIRYNHYEKDPYSSCEKCTPQANACMAVSSRCDLNPKNGNYTLNSLMFDMFGAIDAKIGSFSMFSNGQMVSISGPTSDGIPPFQWSKAQTNNMLHLGQPDLWNFSPVVTSWILPYDPDESLEETKIIFKEVLKH